MVFVKMKGRAMTPFHPHPDSNSSSLAYLDNLPPGTDPYVTPDPAQIPVPRSPRVYNTPKADRELVRGQPDGMDIDTGDNDESDGLDDTGNAGETADTRDNAAGRVSDESPALDTARGLKRARSADNSAESLESSEPELKRQRVSSPHIATAEATPHTAQSQTQDPETIAINAVEAGNLNELRELLVQNKIEKSQLSQWNLTHIAAEFGQLSIVKWLVEQGEDPARTDEKGFTLLQVAAENGHLDIIQWLVDKGADIKQVDDDDNTLVMLAARGGHLEVIKWLHAKGCDIHYSARYDRNAFIQAAKAGHLEVMKWLAEQGSDITHTTDWGGSALMYAAEYGYLNVAEWLIEKGCAVSDGGGIEDEPIYWAVINNQADIVRLLLRHDVDFGPYLDGRPDETLFKAITHSRAEIVELLIPHFDMAIRTENGLTPLMLAADRGAYDSLIPLILATLKHPKANELLQEAAKMATDVLARELIDAPAFLTTGPLEHSKLSEKGQVIITSHFVFEEVNRTHHQLGDLLFHLGSEKGMHSMQIVAASFGILAGLVPWKISHYPKGNFYNILARLRHKYPNFDDSLGEFLKGLQEKLNQFTDEDIDIVTEMAHGWEEKHLAPVFENLFETCLSHALGADPESAMVDQLTASGIYQPLAKGIAKAWQKAWAPVSAEAKPLLAPDNPVTVDDWENEDLANLDPTTGLVALTPATVGPKIDGFLETTTATTLFDAFRTALRQEFDSVATSYLQVNASGLSQPSRELYADLINRQLSMLAQFWRQ